MSDFNLDVQVYPIDDPKGSTLAFAKVTVENLIVIGSIRVVEGENGLFVTMPQSQDKKTGDYHDIAFPIDSGLRIQMNAAVLDKYDAAMRYAEKRAERAANRSQNHQPHRQDNRKQNGRQQDRQSGRQQGRNGGKNSLAADLRENKNRAAEHNSRQQSKGEGHRNANQQGCR
jgi:stage V sporulation protein G